MSNLVDQDAGANADQLGAVETISPHAAKSIWRRRPWRGRPGLPASELLVPIPALILRNARRPTPSGRIGRRHVRPASRAARANSIAVFGSVLERRGDQIMNCAAYHDSDGSLGAVYRKIHLFRLFDEHLWLGEGESPATLAFPWGAAGLSICYDLRFPELFRRYAVAQGAKLMLLCAEWPLARVEHWRTLLIARAIENQCFVVATNSCGDTGGTVFGGHSMIIDPWGKVVVEAGEDEGLLTAEIDLEEVDRVRRQIPVFEDRRPDAYLTN